MKIQDSVSIDAERTRVFEVFCDLENGVANIRSMTEFELLAGSAQLNVGTKWRETRTMFGQASTMEMWVTGYEENESYVVEAESDGTRYRSEYRFAAEGKGTRVGTIFEGRPLSLRARLANIMGALFAGAAKKAMHEDLLDLKRVCEAV